MDESVDVAEVEEELEWFKIKSYFTMIVTREVAAKYHRIKYIPLLPFQEQRRKLYECVVGLTKFDPRNILCIGDSVEELAPARKMQMTTIGVLTGFSNKKELEKVTDFLIDDINQFSGIINNLARARQIV